MSTPDDADCFIGVCGYYDNATGGCLVGTYDDVSGDDWNCRGSDTLRADDDEYCELPDPTPGKCDYNNIGGCLEGDSSDPSGQHESLDV